MSRKKIISLIIFLFLFIIFLGFISFLYFELKQPVILPRKAYLEVKLSGQVVDRPAVEPIRELLFGPPTVSLHDLWINLNKAKEDERIRCLLIHLGPLICDWGKVNELREFIKDWRTSGKKVYFYVEELPEADREYYLASAGDKIILHPLGWMGINGLGGHIPFFKKTLKKIGLNLEVEKIEEYKTAYNPFTEEKFTPAHREMITSLNEDIFKEYVSTVAQSRGLTEEQFVNLLNQGLFQGKQAKEKGLVDDVLFPDELSELMKEEGQKLTRVTIGTYSRVGAKRKGPYRGKRIAILYAQGPILNGEGPSTIIASDNVSRWLRQIREDRRIKAVVLRIDSPGGSAVGSDIIWREVVLTRKVKPIVVSMSDVAGSGGYWIAMAASKIVAHPQSLTGSIGVLAAKLDLSELYKKAGINAERLVFGEHADMYSTFRPLSKEEKDQLKDQIRWTYDQFLERVAEGRGKNKDEIDKIGRGRVWTGKQAQEIGLVDELGGLKRALELARQLAGIPRDEEIKLDVWPKKLSLFSLLFKRSENSFVSGLYPSFSTLNLVQLLLKENLLALMPFDFCLNEMGLFRLINLDNYCF
ncbi:MAG: signal peptide peptidase SppA [Candidatus Aminicenantes bacterium]|nr:signal peptide peptidase SppA [Candidatus Aminicenantes bacterium]